MKEKFEKEQKDNYIEDPMLDMPDMEDDEKFRQWLEETYIDEAELIEKSLLAGQEYEKNLDIAEELSVPREKFYQRLKEEGLYEDETDDTSEVSKKAVRCAGTEIAGDAVAKKNNASVSRTAGEKIISMEARTSKEAGGAEKATRDKIIDMETRSSKEDGISVRATEGSNSSVKTGVPENGNEAVAEKKTEKSSTGRKKRGYLRLGKVAGVAGVCLLCVFAASMTSEANRSYFIRGIKYLSGNDTKVIIGNDEENEDVNIDEYEAIAAIEDKIGVEVPEFYYRPYEMQFLSYEISEETYVAKMEYQYNENILFFIIDKQNENTASDIKSTHGEKKKEILLDGDGDEIAVEKVNDDGEKIANYVAQWSRNNIDYVFSGRISWEELKKILEQMKF
ncbi:DUF4367 domain-containing protein [Blautia intestinalis]|uniref:DUF4367 domain-containing protein n=1 Tax=Blautia intestinalis TaxID=2763028 RepID=UPI0022E62B85|nr:DUF4367 domain-containing protein [Blautia intestinalis]